MQPNTDTNSRPKTLRRVRPTTVCKMLDIPPGTFAHWRATGYFNVPAIRLGPRAIGFDLDLVEEWIAARPLAADAEAK